MLIAVAETAADCDQIFKETKSFINAVQTHTP